MFGFLIYLIVFHNYYLMLLNFNNNFKIQLIFFIKYLSVNVKNMVVSYSTYLVNFSILYNDHSTII